MEALLPFLIVCPLVFVAGFVDAIAGGGGLISLPAYLISGLPVHTALGTNKMSSLMGTSLATWRYARHGFVNLRRSAVCAAFALVGSALGANVALLVSDGVFKLIMLVVVPLTGCYIMFHKGFGEAREPLAPTRTLALCTAISFAMGLYDGFYGPGTGTFLILLFLAAAHLTLDEAAGTAKVVNLTTNVGGLLGVRASRQRLAAPRPYGRPLQYGGCLDRHELLHRQGSAHRAPHHACGARGVLCQADLGPGGRSSVREAPPP